MNKKMRIVTLMLCFLLVATLFSACTDKAGSKDEGDKIKVGVIAPLTGKVSTYGIATYNGIKLAIDEVNAGDGVNGKKIELIEHDDKGEPTDAVTGYRKLVDRDKIKFLLGAVTSGPTNSVAGHANKDNMPMITATATAENVTKSRKSVFRACFIDPFQGDLIADYAFKKLGYKKAAILYNNSDDYSTGLKNAFEATAKAVGLKIVAVEAYQAEAIDFSAQLTNIKKQNPDVVYVPVYYQDVAKIVAQADDATLKFLGGDGWDGATGQVSDNQKALLEGAIYCSQYSPQSDDAKVKKFLEDYKTKYNTDANQFAVLGYDAAMMMVQAMKEANTTDADKVIAALEGIKFNGLTGDITFDENHNPIKQAAIIEIKDGKDIFKEFYKKSN